MEESYELDLTYITERIIAVSFPGNCSEEIYQNNFQDVIGMLKSRHGGNYMVRGDAVSMMSFYSFHTMLTVNIQLHAQSFYLPTSKLDMIIVIIYSFMYQYILYYFPNLYLFLYFSHLLGFFYIRLIIFK
uniref:Uncharacterized protein n=1 Tax=Laticauda laticaudata TaxID=8630 RepID=A0A8C5SWY8_LATLA